MIYIYINGVQIVRQKGSMRVQKEIESRSTARFTVLDETGVGAYVKGQPVEIRKTWLPPFYHTLFRGFINSVEKVRVPNSTIVYHAITCVGNAYLADKRIKGDSYVATSAGDIVTDIIADPLAAEGVTAGTIQAGPTLAEVVLNYPFCSEALDKLAAYSGFFWDINDFKELNFMVRTTVPAPFGLDDSNIKRGSVKFKQQANQYRNRQYLRGGLITTVLQTETFTGDGTNKSFACGFPLASEPTSVKVNAVAKTIGIKGIDTTFDSYWAKSDSIVTFAAAPGVGLAVEIKYYGEYNFRGMTEDVVQIVARQAVEGGSGINEAVDDDPSVTSVADAIDVMDALLDKYGIIGEIFSFSTFDYGLEPGQLATITYPEYNLASADMLIESVEVSEFGPETPLYSVKAVYGPAEGDWTKLFGRLARIKSELLDRLTVGKDEVLVIISQHYGNVEVDETVTKNVYACTICGTGAVCGAAPGGSGVVLC